MEKLFYIEEKTYEAYNEKKEIDLLLNEGWTIKSITPFAQYVSGPNTSLFGAFGAYIVLEKK